MESKDLRRIVIMRRLVKYFFDEIKYRLKLPCLRAGNREMSTKYIVLNLFRKIVNLPFYKQYEIEEQLALETMKRTITPDAAVVRLDYDLTCVVIGSIEATSNNVNLYYELERENLKYKRSNTFFWQPGRVILYQDDNIYEMLFEDIFLFDNNFNLPKVKAKIEEFIEIIIRFFAYKKPLFQYDEYREKYFLIK